MKSNIAAEVESQLESEGIQVLHSELHEFPGETHLAAYVSEADKQRAISLVNSLEARLERQGLTVFVAIRIASEDMRQAEVLSKEYPAGPIESLSDERCQALVNLISARSRVSNALPSLVYVPDSRANMAVVTAARHQLIFGRRGAGKTALLVEARKRLEKRHAITAWVNIQTLRHESPERIVLYALREMAASLVTSHEVVDRSEVHNRVALVLSHATSLLDELDTDAKQVQRLIPRAQEAFQAYLKVSQGSLFVFLDDFYYVARAQQPLALDMIHGLTRDSAIWLKIASIRHLTRWWQSQPPVGLQSGQDADIVDLDITLQDPASAKIFLEGILAGFASSVNIPALPRIFRSESLDRLLLASGAVPRDYLVLAGNALTIAQEQQNRRYVGVQDVNKAAGDAAASKIQELEDDMASNVGVASMTLSSLRRVRSFCLEETGHTYFLVGFRDREENPDLYTRLTELMDVRLVHLVNAGVSHAHSAGERSEAFMLDLSQFSGARLKQRIRVLDFAGGHFVSRETRSHENPRVATTPRQLVTMLRAAPTLALAELDQ